MFGLLCKRLIRDFKKKVTHLGFVQNNHNALQCIVIRSSSSSSSSLTSEKKRLKSEDEQSFRVSYLIDSCGLSLENAIIASQKARFKMAGNPDSVLTLLRKYGFTNTHISKIVSKFPSLLSSNPDKTLHPKLEFFSSIGVSDSDIANVLSSDPQILMRSLQNLIIPTYDLLKGIVLDDKHIVSAFRHSFSRILNSKNILLNIELLRELGVPQSSISLLIAHYPTNTYISHDRFVYIVKELREMGFDPSKTAFVHAIHVLGFLGISKLQRKFEVYGKFGWSKDDALSAFKYYPMCMVLSESKIVRKMNFLVNKMGWTPKIIARHSLVIGMSLEKRIIPRCLVVQVLLHKGLIKKDFSITTLLVRSETYFLQRYVTRFQELVPQLMDVYGGKMDIVDLGIGFKKICEIEDYNFNFNLKFEVYGRLGWSKDGT